MYRRIKMNTSTLWMRIPAMAQEITNYLKRECSVNGLTNAFFNGLICWMLIKNNGTITWWGQHNFGYDILATGFILPFIVTLIVIPIQRSKMAILLRWMGMTMRVTMNGRMNPVARISYPKLCCPHQVIVPLFLISIQQIKPLKKAFVSPFTLHSRFK